MVGITRSKVIHFFGEDGSLRRSRTRGAAECMRDQDQAAGLQREKLRNSPNFKDTMRLWYDHLVPQTCGVFLVVVFPLVISNNQFWRVMEVPPFWETSMYIKLVVTSRPSCRCARSLLGSMMKHIRHCKAVGWLRWSWWQCPCDVRRRRPKRKPLRRRKVTCPSKSCRYSWRRWRVINCPLGLWEFKMVEENNHAQ